ncbi:MAG: DUF4327 family protein [Cyanobacteria bacterium J083]|nr:MAG: DUF4327 family protein [Cyanobacteria bacterium J083]
MIARTLAPHQAFSFPLSTIREEVKRLLEKGIINRHQPLYVLCEFIPAREWFDVECELERHDYLLRDRISDLLESEVWLND